MIKRYCILLLLVLYSLNSQAGWSDFVAWLEDPCNAGAANIEERQDGILKRSVKPNRLCPPWNKERPNNTCLIKFDYPGNFTPFYLNYCAESTSESNYFEPKIHIRYQACNFFACWNLAKTLSWDGQCMIWPSGYAIPLLRICARVAVPAQPSKVAGAAPMPADPGYTLGEHLDAQGVTVKDKELIDYEGKTFQIVGPKLCAYKDPSLIDTLTGGIFAGIIDLMDYNPVKQPIHNTGTLHPIAKILLMFVQQATDNSTSLGDMLGGLLDSIGGKIIPGLDIFKKIFDGIGAIIKYIGQIFIAIIKEFGQFNRMVDGCLGCVELPIGPFPPPFCPKIEPFVPSPSTQSICEIGGFDAQNNPILTASTTEHPCVVSLLTNNFIRNSVRVSYDNFVPLCVESDNKKIDTSQTDQCVKIINLSAVTLPSVMHMTTANWDVIRACGNVPSSAPCVSSMIAEPTISTLAGKGFRVVYSSVTGKSSVPSSYFYSDLPDCTSANAGGTNCQKIWGVNTGSFVDVSLIFPTIETSYSTTPISKGFSLNNTNNKSTYFTASITRSPSQVTLDSNQFIQQPSQICVFSNNILAGCEQRVPLQPNLTNNCTSTQISSTTGPNTTGAAAKDITVTNNPGPNNTIITTTNITSADATTTTTTVASVSCLSSTTCVGPNGSVVSCSGIASAPALYPCGSSDAINLGFNCSNSFFVPKFVTRLQSGSDSTAAVLQPLAVSNTDTTDYRINLAGYDFTSFVTDNTLIQTPFPAGVNSANPSSIYGNYTPGPVNNIAAPYTMSGSTITPVDGIYLSGLEYMNGKYVEGGTYTCLQPDGLEPCGPNNTTNCVLTNLANNNIINCKDFLNLTVQYPGMVPCSDLAAGISIIQTEKTVNGPSGGSVVVKKCTNNNYCYTNSANVKAICQVTTSNAARANPAPVSDPLAKLNSNQYYDLNLGSNSNYDQNLYAVRSKTSVELGLCTAIPWPVCSAVSEANGTWPATPLGQAVTGTCNTNYGTSQSLKRYCTTNLNNQTVALTPLPAGVTCTYLSCPAGNDSNATWAQTPVGQQATGQCNSGYSSYGTPTRTCNASSPSTAAWSGVSNGCLPGTFQFQNNNNYPITDGNGNLYGNGTVTASSYIFGYSGCCVWAPNYYNNFYSSLTFYIEDVSKLDYFYINSLTYDDYLQIYVNNVRIFNDPWQSWDKGPSWGGAQYFQQHLINGVNTIRFDNQIVNGGHLYYNISFRKK